MDFDVLGVRIKSCEWGRDLVIRGGRSYDRPVITFFHALFIDGNRDVVAETIKSFLHFSVPDEEPLTEYESWMPDFMSGLAKGIQRDVVRAGVVTISVSFSVTQKWLRLLTGYKQQKKIRVGFFDPETASVRQAEMYVEGFKEKLKKDTSYKGLWNVSFSLKEL